MTNREKFKDVFGLGIDGMSSDLCDIVDHTICIDADDCPSCPVFHFWDKTYKEDNISKEAEFHCGIEESGFHAYNCNDCPNKCEEWYQWDKEMKK